MRMLNYRCVNAQESTRQYPSARSCLNFFGQGSNWADHSHNDVGKGGLNMQALGKEQVRKFNFKWVLSQVQCNLTSLSL